MSGPRPLTITGAIAGCAGPAEPVVTPGKGGKRIPPERALEQVFEHSLGLHTTRRDVQLAASQRAGRRASSSGTSAS